MNNTENSKPIFLSGLNGLRTIAALGVLFSHLNLSLSHFGILNYSLFGFKNNKPIGWLLGEHGVTMFFVLSGFLITYLLLKEYEKTNSINIKQFYIRRCLRIWPLYFVYIFISIIALFYFSNIDSRILYYLSFLANIPFINSNAYPGMDHLWSISVEEQFYLFWPLMFLWLIKRQFINKLIIIISILSIIRILLWFYIPFSTPALISVVNRFDCMMFGGLGAYIYYKKYFPLKLINNKITQSIAWGILFLLIINKLSFFNSIIEIFLIENITLFIIIGQIEKKNRIFNLENKVMSYLGKLSFGIYIYHPLILFVLSQAFKKYHIINSENELGYFILLFITIPLLTIFISNISYDYIEIKFLKLKHKYSIIKSTNIKN